MCTDIVQAAMYTQQSQQQLAARAALAKKTKVYILDRVSCTSTALGSQYSCTSTALGSQYIQQQLAARCCLLQNTPPTNTPTHTPQTAVDTTTYSSIHTAVYIQQSTQQHLAASAQQ